MNCLVVSINNDIFQNRLKKLRKDKKLSQAELGEILHISGQSVSKWETGKAEPGITMINTISSYFNVSTDWLLGNEGLDKDDRMTLINALREKGLDNEQIKTIVNLADIFAKSGKDYEEHKFK